VGARYLLIEFDDEATALKLKAQLDERTRAGRSLRVVGLFAKPTNTCTCDPALKVTNRSHDSSLKRGKKFGWWVCTICGRPDSQLTGLRNLLRPRDLIAAPSWDANDNRGRSTKWYHYIGSLSGLVLSAMAFDSEAHNQSKES
jgi:hypothetical protein